jgi:hypothetical protein
MTDISKCEGIDCPIRDKCRRFTAKPNEYWQSYIVQNELMGDYKNGKCDEFWEWN